MVNDLVLHNDWHVVARSQDLQKGTVQKTRLLGEDLVLWRCEEQVMAWQDVCPHRGASLALGWVEGDTLVCPYHGLAFNQVGQCVYVPAHPDQPPPAMACVRSYQTQERYGLLWVCLGKPEQDLPPFPEWDDPTYHRKLFGGPYHYRSSGQRAIENFIDVAHLPFVHGGILGDPKRALIEDYQVELHSDGIAVKEVSIWQPDTEGSGQGEINTFSFGVLRPLTAYFHKGLAESRLTLFFTVTPVEEVECIAWIWMFMNYAYEVPMANFQTFIDGLMPQDISIVESQRPQRLPLDLQAEFNLPCDRASVAYRKWLKQLGVTFGTT